MDNNCESKAILRKIETAAHDAGQKMRQAVDQAEGDIESATRKTVDQIRAEPLKSTFLAAGIGLVLGLLLGKRS